jgi:hypothetical protein
MIITKVHPAIERAHAAVTRAEQRVEVAREAADKARDAAGLASGAEANAFLTVKDLLAHRLSTEMVAALREALQGEP